MKRIDTWLHIQRYVAEAGSISFAKVPREVEILARASHTESKGRTFIHHHKTI